jgi:membrane-associated protein
VDFLLDAVTDSPWTYVAVAGIVFVDDFIPVAPGDTAMITAGILAANDQLALPLVIAAGILGGIAGDNLFYLLGRRYGPAVASWLGRRRRLGNAYRWSMTQIQARGPTIILVGRFVPGFRTATTFASGVASLRFRRFFFADALAACAWAGYTALLGYLGGSAFRDALWQPLLIGLGVAFVLGLAAEAWRRRLDPV